MQQPSRLAWHDDHSFGQDKKRPGQIRTFIVIGAIDVGPQQQ